MYYMGGIEKQNGNVCVYRVREDGFCSPLNPRLDLHNHSPTGFHWGYRGSGPAQLALALLADHLGDDEKAQSLYQGFKDKVISALAGDKGWELTPEDIDKAIENLDSSDNHS